MQGYSNSPGPGSDAGVGFGSRGSPVTAFLDSIGVLGSSFQVFGSHFRF